MTAVVGCPSRWYNVSSGPIPVPSAAPVPHTIPGPPPAHTPPPACSYDSLCALSSWTGVPCDEVVLVGPEGLVSPCSACWDGGEQCTSASDSGYCGISNCEGPFAGVPGPPNCSACIQAPASPCVLGEFTCACEWCPAQQQCTPAPPSYPSQPRLPSAGCAIRPSDISTAEVCALKALCSVQQELACPNATVYNDTAAGAAGLRCQLVGNKSQDWECVGDPFPCSELGACDICVNANAGPVMALDAPCMWCPTTRQCMASSQGGGCPSFPSGYDGVYDPRFGLCSLDDFCAASEPSGYCAANVGNGIDSVSTCATCSSSTPHDGPRTVVCSASALRCPCLTLVDCTSCLESSSLAIDAPCSWCTSSQGGFCGNTTARSEQGLCSGGAPWLSGAGNSVCSSAESFCQVWNSCENCTNSHLNSVGVHGVCVWCAKEKKCLADIHHNAKVRGHARCA